MSTTRHAYAVDWDVIEGFEGWRSRGYVPTAAGQVLGQSGVTIGPGVDLGQWSTDQLRRVGVPAELVDRLAPWIGVRGAPALAIAGNLVLAQVDVDRLARPIRRAILEAVADRFDRAAARTGFMAFGALPRQLQTVIASVAFQYGAALAVRTPKFWRLVTTGQVAETVAELRAFGDAYSSRRCLEAAYLAAILPPGAQQKSEG